VTENAQKHDPQAITRNGRRAAVIVSAEEWERKTRRPAHSQTSLRPHRCVGPALPRAGKGSVTLVVNDPEGNSIALAEAIDPAAGGDV
jgi:hypothetical protein